MRFKVSLTKQRGSKMSDKNMIEEINVSKCKYFNNGWCLLSESCDAIRYKLCGDMTLFDCYYKQLQREKRNSQQVREFLYYIEVNISEYQALTFDKPRTMRENACIYNILNIINEVKKVLNGRSKIN